MTGPCLHCFVMRDHKGGCVVSNLSHSVYEDLLLLVLRCSAQLSLRTFPQPDFDSSSAATS